MPDGLIGAILSACTSYDEGCLAFCDLAPRCYQQARDADDPVILGEEVRRFLGTIRLSRAVALLDGVPPRDQAERDLVQRIEAARGVLAR